MQHRVEYRINNTYTKYRAKTLKIKGDYLIISCRTMKIIITIEIIKYNPRHEKRN